MSHFQPGSICVGGDRPDDLDLEGRRALAGADGLERGLDRRLFRGLVEPARAVATMAGSLAAFSAGSLTGTAAAMAEVGAGVPVGAATSPALVVSPFFSLRATLSLEKKTRAADPRT